MHGITVGALSLFLGALFTSASSATQRCGGEAGWASAEISGFVSHPTTFRRDHGDWSFLLSPTEFGWRIEMTDGTRGAVPVFATPMRPVKTNPTNIAGWHFRNRDNTGPNAGDVNAPQALRRFAFGSMAKDGDANEFGGLGELKIEAFTLTPTEAGVQAGMTSLNFSACIVWRPASGRLAPLVLADPGVAYETAVSTILSCGFDDETYRLSDRMAQGREGGQQPYLEPDLDGDNIPDLVIPVIRKTDNAPGLAICLLGDERLIMAGYTGRIGTHLDPVYFGRADFWQVHKGGVGQGVAEGPPPTLRGDAILFGKEDTSSVLLFLTPSGNPDSYWQGD